MRHPKLIIAGAGLAAVAAVGGVTAAAATGGTYAGYSTTGHSASTTGHSASTTGHSASTTGHSAAAATVRTASATVAGKTETILVNSGGLPLYYYQPDTAAKSLVTGGLAALWPPLTSAAPTAAGAGGKITVVNDAHGHQVAYNGHLLYTFVSDHPGQVTGQGVQNFFVATPGLTSTASSPAPAGMVPATQSGHGYGW